MIQRRGGKFNINKRLFYIHLQMEYWDASVALYLGGSLSVSGLTLYIFIQTTQSRLIKVISLVKWHSSNGSVGTI